jgi:hypothetical protein
MIKDIRDEINTTLKVLTTQQSVLLKLFKMFKPRDKDPKDKELEEGWAELVDLDYVGIGEANMRTFRNMEEEAKKVHDAVRIQSSDDHRKQY